MFTNTRVPQGQEPKKRSCRSSVAFAKLQLRDFAAKSLGVCANNYSSQKVFDLAYLRLVSGTKPLVQREYSMAPNPDFRNSL